MVDVIDTIKYQAVRGHLDGQRTVMERDGWGREGKLAQWGKELGISRLPDISPGMWEELSPDQRAANRTTPPPSLIRSDTVGHLIWSQRASRWLH